MKFGIISKYSHCINTIGHFNDRLREHSARNRKLARNRKSHLKNIVGEACVANRFNLPFYDFKDSTFELNRLCNFRPTIDPEHDFMTSY